MVEREVVDLDALERDASARIEALSDARQRLSLDAIGDGEDDARQELANVESELAAAEGELQRVELARREGERRADEAHREAEEQRRQGALDRSRELQGQREAAGRKVDKAFAAAGRALAELDRICTQQGAELRVSGMETDVISVLPEPWRLEAALSFAFLEAGVPAGMLTLAPRVSGVTPAPFAGADSRLIEPAEK